MNVRFSLSAAVMLAAECLCSHLLISPAVSTAITSESSSDDGAATKMRVDQMRRVLQIEGTARQIETVKKRVGALLERVSSDGDGRQQGGGFGGW